MSMEHGYDTNRQRRRRVIEGNVTPIATTHHAWAGWQSKPRICHERPATDRLSHDTFSYLSCGKINHADFETHTVRSGYKDILKSVKILTVLSSAGADSLRR